MKKIKEGYTFEYLWEFISWQEDFNKYSISSGKTGSIGWEDGDILKVVHITDGRYVILNTARDVLTTTVIEDEGFFGVPLTESEYKVQQVVKVMVMAEDDSQEGWARALVKSDMIK